MSAVPAMVATLLGGVGVFLLGMKHLSEGLQSIAGGGLRKFMAKTASHRLVCVTNGILSTIIVQSSAIITAMLVGFVASGMVTLVQAISVIIGANIGTAALRRRRSCSGSSGWPWEGSSTSSCAVRRCATWALRCSASGW